MRTWLPDAFIVEKALIAVPERLVCVCTPAGSFAAVYLTMYHDGPRSKVLSPAGAILEIVGRALRAPGNRREPPRRQIGVAAIHLRVGDVLELAVASDDDLECVGGGSGIAWKNRDDSRNYTVLELRPYIRPTAYYEYMAEALHARNVSRVVLVAASGYDMASFAPTYARSCRYVKRVEDVFSRRGFSVGRRLGKSPDADLAFFTTVDVFVASGGVYGALASDVAALNNVTILRAVPNASGHPWIFPKHGPPRWPTADAGSCVRASAYMLAPHVLRPHRPAYHKE